MASKKKAKLVRCMFCGVPATKQISVEPVCDNIVCHVAVTEYIMATVAESKKEVAVKGE